jgi:hypothetical protein
MMNPEDKPIPCKKFEYAPAMAWVAKLIEDTDEVVQEAAEYHKILEHAHGNSYPDRAKAIKEGLAMGLTDIITICTSWLYAIGYDEEARCQLQRCVNEKNRKRGYHDEANF